MRFKIPTNISPHLGEKLLKPILNSGDLSRARQLFDKIPEPNLHSWANLISAYTKQGHSNEAVRLYSLFRKQNIQLPDRILLLLAVKACAASADLSKAKEIHEDAVRFRFLSDLTGRGIDSTEFKKFSFVARGAVILAEHTTRPSNLPSIAAQWLKNLPADPHKKFTMKYDGHTFNFLVEDGYGPYVYGVVARETARTQQILFEFLDCIRQDFKKIYGHGEGDAATAKSLSKKFGPRMKQNMQWVVDHAEEIDRVAKVKAQISEVQVIITDNVNKILERGEQINSVVDKAEALHDSSLEYRNKAREIRRKMWYQNAKIKLIILGIILLILALIIWASICNGFNCS